MKAQAPEPRRFFLDLKGEVCPYTFVKAKLALEELELGEILELVVDFPPASRNLPKSMESEGHDVLSVVEARPGEWRITVKKNRE